MKRTIACILSAIFLITSVSAQNNDSKATGLIDQLASNLKSFSNMRIEFTYQMDNDQQKLHEKTKGTILVEKNKFRILLDGKIIINDGKAVYTYLPEAKEVQINPVEEESDQLSPTSLLNNYKSKYRIKYIREENSNGKEILIADMIPIKGQKFFKVRLYIETKNASPISFLMYDKSGTVFTYAVNKFEKNATLKAGTFEFKKSDYPGAEVVDMR
ncbi:MAG TPA: outer membrane lipoprotein carrier protein LolA [Bacteroidales bacterium]|nr:outer membrane lipoprotein carrier protein LolA [Bacteroidales bacterium]